MTKATNTGAGTAVASAAVGAAEVVTEAAVSAEVSGVTPIPNTAVGVEQTQLV